MKSLLRKFINNLADEIIYPFDTDEIRHEKLIYTLLATILVGLNIINGISYIFNANYELGMIYILQSSFLTVSLIVFLTTRKYNIFILSILTSVFIFPLIFFWALGGILGIITIVIWALILTICGFVLHDRKTAVFYLQVYFFISAFGFILRIQSVQGSVLLQNNQFILFIVTNVLMLCVSAILAAHYRLKKVERIRINKAKQLSDMLPSFIAERIKDEQRPVTDSYDAVTVLFADIVGFTRLAERYSSKELVDILNLIFSTFDGLAEKFGLEKIKTIGDAYMAVAGIPDNRPDHAQAAAEMALEMLAELEKLTLMMGEPLNIRIGLNSGPVIAGVIGTKRAIYDVWGDTVNIASRMESHGVAGTIQLSSSTYEILKNGYNLRKRGNIEVKGKGRMSTYFLVGKNEYIEETDYQFISGQLSYK